MENNMNKKNNNYQKLVECQACPNFVYSRDTEHFYCQYYKENVQPTDEMCIQAHEERRNLPNLGAQIRWLSGRVMTECVLQLIFDGIKPFIVSYLGHNWKRIRISDNKYLAKTISTLVISMVSVITGTRQLSELADMQKEMEESIQSMLDKPLDPQRAE